MCPTCGSPPRPEAVFSDRYRLDAARDAAALLRTFHEGDREGREVLLDHGDTRAVAKVLAAVLHATITATYSGCRGCAAEFVTTWKRRCAPESLNPRKEDLR